MTEEMFYGDVLDFDKLMERIKELQKRIFQIK